MSDIREQQKWERERWELDMLRADLDCLRSDYVAERSLYINLEQAAVGNFSRALLTLSAALFGFSLTFVQLFDGHLAYPGWLYGAWILFALTVFISLHSYQDSEAAFRSAQDYVGDKYHFDAARLASRDKVGGQGYMAVEELGDPPDYSSIRQNNSFAFVALALGTVCLITFSIINLTSDV